MTDSQSLHNLENKNKNKKEKKYNKLALIANFFNTCSFQCPFIEKKIQVKGNVKREKYLNSARG